MTHALRRIYQAIVPGHAGLACLAVKLLGLSVLLCGAEAHAQDFKQLPGAAELFQMKPPAPDELFRLDSEAALRKRIADEAKRRPKAPPTIFPAEPAVEAPYPGRFWSHQVVFAEPSYVCYGKLFFEQINSERYGWDLGPIHPLVSTGIFLFDVATLPYHMATDPCRWYECSAGYCLPGDPVPLLWYPPELSATGALAEVGVIAALIAIFP